MLMLAFYLVIWFACASGVDSLNVLLFAPAYSRSHILFNSRLASTLANGGHNVTAVLQYFHDRLDFQVPPEVHKISVYLPEELTLHSNEMRDIMQRSAFEEFNFAMVMRMISTFNKFQTTSCEMVHSDEVLQQLKSVKFDLILAHCYAYCPLSVTHMLNTTTVWVSGATYILEFVASFMQIPYPTSYVPVTMSANTDHMTFRQRIKNSFGAIFQTFFALYMPWSILRMDASLMQRMYGTKAIDLDSYAGTLPTLFISGEPFIDFPRPLTNSMRYIGDLPQNSDTQQSSAKLSKEWESVMNSSNDGIILFSLGTIVNTTQMPARMSTAFIDAFAHFKTYTIIWKSDTILPGVEKLPNIKMATWVPQREILRDERTKLFITHGGYNSLLEGCNYGVPLLLVPLFADQFANALRAERFGLGRTLNKLSLNKDDIVASVTNVLSDTSYRTRSKHLADTIRTSKIIANKDHLLHDIVRYAKHGHHSIMKRANSDLWFFYYSFDVTCLLYFSLIVVFFVFAR